MGIRTLIEADPYSTKIMIIAITSGTGISTVAGSMVMLMVLV